MNFKRLFRFSLRTLLIATLFIGSATALALQWAPWRLQFQLQAPPESLSNGTYSPDGGKLAGWIGSAIQLWDMSTGRKLITILSPDSDAKSLEFSPDGARIALLGAKPSNSFEEFVKVFDCTTGHLLWTAPLSGLFESIRFTPDGKYVASDGALCMWEAVTGKEVIKVGIQNTGTGCFFFSSDAERLKYEEDERQRTAAMLAAEKLDDFAVRAKSFHVRSSLSSDCRIAVTNPSSTGKVQVWDLGTRARLRQFDVPDGLDYNSMLSPDGRWLLDARGFLDSRDPPPLQVWDLQRGTAISLPAMKTAYHGMAFSPDSRLIAIKTSNDELRVFELPSGRETCRKSSEALSLQISADHKIAASKSDKSDQYELTLVDGDSGKTSANVDACAGWLDPVAFSPDGRQLVTNGDPEMRVWRRHRHEAWWGAMILPEFWTTLVLVVAFAWSLRRDRRELTA